MDSGIIPFQCTQTRSTDLTLSFPHVSMTLLSVKLPLRSLTLGKLLKQVNPYSAMGPDYIHPRILKEAADTLALPLFSLFSYSLSTGVLPSAWKEAHVTPIYKSGDRHSPSSYCPISLTSIPCKILERLIKKAILSHLQRNELISDSNSGTGQRAYSRHYLLRFCQGV